MSNKTILYIEDNTLNMRLVRKILQHAGYLMLEAYMGQLGLRLAEVHRPDLILLDVNLPDMNGFEVLDRLKHHPDLQHIPVIALTANVMNGDRDNCLRAGFDGYLPKPITTSELRAILGYFLNTTSATD